MTFAPSPQKGGFRARDSYDSPVGQGRSGSFDDMDSPNTTAMMSKEQEIAALKAQLAKLTNKKVVLAASSPPADDSLIDDDNPFADSDDEPAPKGGAASAPEVIDDFDALFA